MQSKAMPKAMLGSFWAFVLFVASPVTSLVVLIVIHIINAKLKLLNAFTCIMLSVTGWKVKYKIIVNYRQ